MTSAPDPGRPADPLPTSSTSKRWWRPRRGLVWLGVAAVLVAGTVVVNVVMRGPGPDDVVREYLTAIQQGDVDKALKVAGADRPAGEKARFLTPDALNNDWRIVHLKTTGEHERNGRGWAQVRVTISGPDDVVDGGFDLTKASGRWRLDDPFVSVKLNAMQLRYFDVNGVVTPATEGVSYLMLPGFYRFYGTGSDLVSIKPMTALLLQFLNTVEQPFPFRPAAVSLTKKAEEAVRKTIVSRVDECAKRGKLELGGCQIRPGGGPVHTPDERYFTDVSDVRWKVLRHPTVSFIDDGPYFSVFLTAPGLAELSATGVEIGGAPKRVRFTTQCQIGADVGSWYVVSLTRPDLLDIQQPTRTVPETCD